MSTLSKIRQRLLTINRANVPSSYRHASGNSSSPKLNELTQKASNLVNKFGSKLPQLPETFGKRVDGLWASYKEPISHNLQVTKEVLKQVYIKENLAPPKMEQIKSSYQEVFRNVSSLNFWKQTLESGDWKRLAVYGVEAVGLFSIGEMIGRRHIVGYKLD